MLANVLRAPQLLSDADALQISQQAPFILQRQSSWSIPYPLSLIFSSDTTEKWQIYENLLYSCLRTGDDRSAYVCLEKLKERFGETNERVMGLMGIYHEAIARNDEDLEAILKQYDDVIANKPTNLVIQKRRIALLRSMSFSSQAISGLIGLLEVSPTDAEAWTELAEMYFVEGLYLQTIFSLEEVLAIVPNAWNIHARLGEVVYISTISAHGNDFSIAKGLARSIRCFCRSIELCDDYLRGYYGLKLSALKFLEIIQKPGKQTPSSSDIAEDDLPLPSLPVVQNLSEFASSKLAEIIRRCSSQEKGWTGYDEAEVIAARALLNTETQSVTR